MSIEDQLQKEAEKMVRLAGRNHLKKRLIQFEKQDSSSQISRSGNAVIRWIAIAAAAAFLILVPLWWIQDSKPLSNEQLFATYFETYRSPESIRGEAPGTETLWENAVAQYADNNFNSAALNFEKLAQNDENYLVQFYLGQSLLNLEPSRTEEAITAFRKVLQTEHDYRQQAQWYLALACLKASKTPEARTILEEIAHNEEHYKQLEAKKLLKSL